MRPLAAVLAVAAIAGCAGPKVQRPAHGTFARTTRPEMWARALEAVEQRGFAVRFQDASLGVLVTSEREVQAPCGETTCLAKETLYLRQEDGRAVAYLSRAMWDSAVRTWSAPATPRDVAAVEKEQLAIMKDIADAGLELRASRTGEPCSTDDECERGLACGARRCGPPEKAPPKKRR
jgi:hypothetical protein